ncbi:MAG: N-6 DNA methylase [Halovenus sp.]
MDDSLLGEWDSRLYERYTSVAARRLETDTGFQRARAEWEQFFVDSHGDIFADIGLENPRTDLFVDSLYFDFVVDRLIEAAEREFGFTLVNREATRNTDALSVRFRDLHDRIADSDEFGRAGDGDGFDPTPLDAIDLLDADTAFLRSLYEEIISPELRLALGEYYTPRGVAELAVADLPADRLDSASFLDPGCGSGVFLAVCIGRKIESLSGRLSPAELVDAITDTVLGIDLNPVAVKSAKLSYLVSLLPLLDRGAVDRLELPVFLTDALRLTRQDDITFEGEVRDLTVDHLVGNPPWLTWGTLPEPVKDAWRETYIDQLDLFPHDGFTSRLGHGNDDISVLFVWVCTSHYLAEGGTASFVLKRDILRGPAGKLLRTQSVGGRPLAVRHVHDFSDLRPFGPDAGADAAIYTFSADTDPTFPIPLDSWTEGESEPDFSSTGHIRETLVRDTGGVVPVDADDPSSAWVREAAERAALGECAHEIRHGLKDDAKDVFGIERGQLATLESDHVYPYIASRHVVKYGLFGYDLHLVPLRKANEDNEAELRRTCPDTYEYLAANREALEDRSSTWLEDGPFYNVFGLGEYTWSPYKVVWCRLGFKPDFAVVSTVDDAEFGEKQVVPGDHYMFIPTGNKTEAHFLCGLLNSAVYQRSLGEIASKGKSSLSKAVVSQLALPAYRDTGTSRRLAELSMRAHDVVAANTDVSKRAYNDRSIAELDALQARIDRLVEELLSDGALFPGSRRRASR